MIRNRRLMKKLCILIVVSLVFNLSLIANASWFGTNKNDTVTISKEEYDRLKKYELLDEVKQFIETYFLYYDEPDEKSMMDGAIQGLLSGLSDPYSFYYPEEAWKKLKEEDSGKYAGIGVQMLGNYDDSSVTIIRVFKDTPAERAGLKKGDVFFMVEDIQVTTATMQDAVDKMRGFPGEKVHIEIVRDGEVMPFDLIKAEILVNRVEYKMIDDKIGYIILFEFAPGSKEAFAQAYEDLKSRGMQQLIFDLRDNPGGYVMEAEAIGNLFFDHKLLYYTLDRYENRREVYTNVGAESMPITILVNENSASASEILAAAMQDHKRAKILGQKTFGKGIIQLVNDLSDGKSGFQVTYANYFSPLGNIVHKEGVTPDLLVEMPEEFINKFFDTADLTDPQLAEAYEHALESLK